MHRQRLRRAPSPEVGEDPLDAMFVESRVPAKRHEIAEEIGVPDPRAAVREFHARIVGLAGHRTHRTEEARVEGFRDDGPVGAQYLRNGFIAFDCDRQVVEAHGIEVAFDGLEMEI